MKIVHRVGLPRSSRFLACAGLVAGACIGAGLSSSTGALERSPATTQAAAGHKPLSRTAAIAAAKAQLANYAGVPSFTPPNPPFSVKSLKGKTVAVVTITETSPALVHNIDGVMAAAKAVGLNVTLSNAKTTPSQMTQGLQEAVSHHVTAIILVGIPANFVLSSVKMANAAGIPIVTLDDYQPQPKAKGQGGGPYIYADADTSLYLAGQLSADAAIVHWKGNVNAVLVNSAGLTQTPAVLQGFRKILGNCASCHVLATDNVEIETWFTHLVPLVGSVLKRYPNVNTLMPVFNAMAGLMTPAVKSDGGTGKVIVQSTGTTDYVSLVPAYPSILSGYVGNNDYWNGWLAVNQAMRGILKLAPGNPVGAPPRLVTPAIVKAQGTSADALFGSNYRSGFEKLWELNG
jgi:ribose transport system substrate-binding protein